MWFKLGFALFVFEESRHVILSEICWWPKLKPASELLSAATSAYSSDGSDGPFHPIGNVTLDLSEDGAFNFTSITINNGITVKQ